VVFFKITFFILKQYNMAEQTKPADVKKPEAGHQFSVTTGEGDKTVTKKYKTKLAAMIIPGVNDGKPLTSLEISKSKEAQARLIELGAIGSAIDEVV
jgi:molybdenum cofactor biosynthesis enzyme MoaA